MASIAYIADQHMIEYHRLNGSRTMNFWRLGNMKKFSDFHEGDYLFFLVKGTERTGSKEKGIMGYGHLRKIQSMTFNQMWNTYGNENGYEDKEEFKEAVIRLSKDKKMPVKMGGLYLDNVVFFQSPIYLSEIGITISNRLESFCYLDKEDPQATAKLLSKAKESGADMWSMLMSEEEVDDDYFEEEEISHTIASIHKRIKLTMSDWERKKARKWLREYCETHPKTHFVKGVKTEGFSYSEGICTLIMPIVSKCSMDNTTQAMVGHICLLKNMLMQECRYQIKIKIKLLSDQDVSELEKMCNEM